MMQSITFECEVITPMFLAGADGSTPELRAPSIKGAMRFWWRALNGHLVKKNEKTGKWDYSELKEREGEIFGDTSRRSSVIIKPLIIHKQKQVKISNTPHHRNGYCNSSRNNCNYNNNPNKCSKSTERHAFLYDFSLEILFNPDRVTKNQVEILLTNTFLLGGIGNRSRRGFGSILIKNCPIFSNKETLENYIDFFSKKIKKNKGYPHISKIELGKSHDTYHEVLIKIGESSHNNRHDSLGHVNKRFASPIYTSVIKLSNCYYPIITTLYTADNYSDPKNLTGKLTKKQSDYINSLIND